MNNHRARHTDSAKRPTVLVADDDPFVCTMLRAQLEHSFEIVASACDAQEAITLAAWHRPDIAIIDVQMPAGGGLRATQEIGATVPDTAIVAYSADESDGMVRAIIAAGAISYLRKGARSDDLTLTLTRCLEAHARLRATA